MPLLGAIESGGTKWVCAVGTGPDDLRTPHRIPTTTPDETIAAAVAYFRQFAGLAAIGVGTFGPIGLDTASPLYGHITTTPKPGWGNTDVVGPLRRAFNVPIGFDTDVNAAALGEREWGAARDCDTFVYLTVGTGIGGGAMVNGRLLHGLLHPEMGHIPMPRDAARDPYTGSCAYHGACLEGMASGTAMNQRWRARAETLPPDHPAWALEAHYLAQGITGIIAVLSPQRVILGGGVMQQSHLFPMIRAEIVRLLNGYLQVPAIVRDIDQFIVPPGLGNRAGVLGALSLAREALAAA
ncbi:MAG: ROK family protein [Blastocatellia bacterium]